MAEKPRTPSIAISLLPVVTLVIMLAVAIYIYRGDSLGGASQIVLLIATSICSLIAVFHCKIKWEDIEGQIARNIYGIAPSVIILLLIGTLSGSWMVSGIVPSLIYYGLQVMQTDFFLVACCLLCSIVSVMTGSSWTTIATIVIALMGIGEAQGFATGWVAGAIISGATGTAYAYSIDKLQDRGRFFISPMEQVYAGQGIGEHTRQNDITVNVTKAKQLTNMRASGSDEKTSIAPPKIFSLEEALEYIQADEYVEVTPHSMRLRKILLHEVDRKRASK